jgi:hypothetical protein
MASAHMVMSNSFENRSLLLYDDIHLCMKLCTYESASVDGFTLMHFSGFDVKRCKRMGISDPDSIDFNKYDEVHMTGSLK